MGDNKKSDIITVPNLRSYFFNGLNELNNKSVCPVPQEVIFYSSEVLNRYSLSQDYFEMANGKVREKVLGMKLLEATSLDKAEQTRVYKEVGDTALMVSGYFSKSVNRKIFDQNYYHQLGKTAYSRLNSCVPSFLDVPSFYSVIATSFETVTILISMLASQDQFDSEKHLVFDRILNSEDISDKEYLVSGVTPPLTKKVS